MGLSHDLEGFPLQRVALADDGGLGREGVEVGSVSCVPSMRLTTGGWKR